jgi:hypothetical protein
LYILDRFRVWVTEDGDDTNGKGSIANPYRTISRALVTALNGQTVEVGSGTFNEASGETFPLIPTFNVSVHGRSEDSTFIEPPAGTAAFSLQNKQVSIRYLTIRGSNKTGIGVEFNGDTNTDSLILSHMKIENCRIGAFKTGATDTILFEQSDISDCVYGIVIGEPGNIFSADSITFTNIDSIAVDIISPITNYFEIKGSRIDTAWIGIRSAEGHLYAYNNTFANIDSTAILSLGTAELVELFTVPLAGNNDFTGCANWCVINLYQSDYAVAAQRNTWPSSDSTTIDTQYIYDDDEDSANGEVQFIPFN